MRNEILQAIDNINDVTFETKNSMLASITSYYEKYQTIAEYCSDPATGLMLVMEADAVEFGKKETTLDKIWKGIQRFFRLLVANIKHFIDRVMDLFRKKPDAGGVITSCDSIVLKVLAKSKANVPDDISTWNIPKVDKKKVNKYDKKETVTEAAQYVTVDIPARDGSTFYPKTVRVPKNDIIAEVNNADKTITFHIVGYGKLSSTTATDAAEGVQNKDITGTKKPWLSSSKMALYLVANPDAVKKLSDLVDLVTEIIFNGKSRDENTFNSKCKKLFSSYESGVNHLKADKVVVSMKDLTDFQKEMNNIVTKMDKYANTNTDVTKISKDTINNMNDLSIKLVRIQSSMNLLTSSLEKNLVVNECFVGKIKSLALLDQFVATCIDEGVPPKFIAYNTWLVADACIKGNKEEYKPAWGQSRFVFFPPNKKFVYKIAMNGLGITSNKAEVRTSEMFVKMGRVDLIAPVVKTFERDSIVVMERINNDSQPSYAAILAYTKHVNDAIDDYQKKHNIKLNIRMTDQHKDNVKYDTTNKCYRSIDYGIANRAYDKKAHKK